MVVSNYIACRLLQRHGYRRILLRCVSSAPEANESLDDDETVGPELLLYQRKPSNNATQRLMQSGLFVSTFHTGYWIWYVTDFLPLVNASPMEQLHIHPYWGYAGLSVSIALNAIFIVYPRRFLSKVTYRPNLKEMAFYTHQMPWMQPSTFASRFPVGDQAEQNRPDRQASDYVRIDRQHEKTILEKYGGDISKFRGHLTVGRRWPRYSMDIQSNQDIVEPQLLLEILLRPEYFQLETHENEEDTDVSASPRRRFRRKSRKSGRGRLQRR